MYSKLLVTGGCGFIGSNFINFILSNYPDIVIYNLDKLDYCSNTNYIDNNLIRDNYKFIQGNICDKDFISFILNEYKIEVIVHFAAQSHVDNSFGNSLQFTIDNVLGTHTLLECCKYYQKETQLLKKFIHISTDEVYGEVDLEHPGCSEKSLLNPTNPYAATKAGAEFLVKSYFHSYKLPIIITRMNNVVGPYQYPEKLIPKFILNLLENKKCTVHGKGETRRNFIFADDVSRGISLIINKGEIGEIYNIGSNWEYSVMDILKYLHSKLNIQKPIEEVYEFVEDRPFNDFRYNVETQKIENLGWKIETTFDEAIDKTITWIKKQFF